MGVFLSRTCRGLYAIRKHADNRYKSTKNDLILFCDRRDQHAIIIIDIDEKKKKQIRIDCRVAATLKMKNFFYTFQHESFSTLKSSPIHYHLYYVYMLYETAAATTTTKIYKRRQNWCVHQLPQATDCKKKRWSKRNRMQ